MLNDTSSFVHVLSVYTIFHAMCYYRLIIIIVKNPLSSLFIQNPSTFKIILNTQCIYRDRACHVSYTIPDGDYGLYWPRHYLRFQGERKRGYRGYGQPHRCKVVVHVASIRIVGERDECDYRRGR